MAIFKNEFLGRPMRSEGFENRALQVAWDVLTHDLWVLAEKRRSYSYLVIKGIMIFDIRTGHFVGNNGFLSVDTPPLGGLARWDDYIARYIGYGNWP